VGSCECGDEPLGSGVTDLVGSECAASLLDVKLQAFIELSTRVRY
jgi:hypothetical protein